MARSSRSSQRSIAASSAKTTTFGDGDGGGSEAAKSSRAPSEVSTNAAVRKVRSDQRNLLKAEYDSFLASQQSDVNRSLHDLSVRSLNASLSEGGGGGSEAGSSRSGAGQRLRYSRLARTRMKRKLGMQKGHIDKHERDVEERLSCHTFQKKNNLNTHKHPESLTRMLLSAMLGVALNASQSPVQLADLVRFHREDHISHTNLMQYLPEELDPSCYTETIAALQKGLAFAHSELRVAVSQLVKFLNVDPETPNLRKLCARYIEELCLPSDLLVLVERLMAVFPPKMKCDGTYHFPNYEGRAMAYIIFVLKLLFGLNDSTEVRMSKSAEKLNQKTGHCGPSSQKLFVFTQWIAYLEMRKVILAQVHHPTNRLVAKEEGIEQDADLFIDHTLRRKRSADSFRVAAKRVNRNWMSKLKDAITNMVDTHHRAGASENSCCSIEFEPSLTPNRSYFETFLLAYNREGKIHVPNSMRVDHSERILMPFVDPTDLKRDLQVSYQLILVTKKVKSSIRKFHFIEAITVSSDILAYQEKKEPPYFIAEECSETEWSPAPKQLRPSGTHEQLLDQILIRNEVETQTTNLHRSNRTDSPAEVDESTDNFTQADTSSLFSQDLFPSPSEASSFIAPNQQHRSATEAAASASTTPGTSTSLLTSNFDYWVRFYGQAEAHSMELFEERIAPGLPENFLLVLNECARLVENRPQALYKELMVLEAYFFHAVQPVERFFRGGQGQDPEQIEVLFDDAWRRDITLLTRVKNAMKDY